MTWVAAFIAWAVFLQAVEQILLQRKLSEFDPWESSGLNNQVFMALQWCRLIAATAALVFPLSYLTGIMIITTYMTAVRYRGTFNGGSDTVTLHILAAVGLAQAFPKWTAEAQAYIVIFVTLSYFIAGAAKLATREWRDGSALTEFLLYSNAAIPNRITERVRRSANGVRGCAWLVMIWELLFPLGLLWPSGFWILLPLGFLFHLLNFYFFGLNRFFWAWLAAYPAFIAILKTRTA